MSPEDIAAEILRAQHAIWALEWIRADLAALLEQSTDENMFRALAIGELDTSWRNLHRWASKARQTPPEARDPLYAPRTHPLPKMGF